MTRRITTAIVGVTALVLLALGIPLGIVIRQSIIDSEVVEMHAVVAHLQTEINLPINPAELSKLARESDSPPPFGIYDDSGRRVYGVGPAVADAPVQAAQHGMTSSSTDGAIVVAAPLTDRNEDVLVVVRVSESLAGVQSHAQHEWTMMVLAGAIALGGAWIVARRLARRLGQPVTELAASAAKIGSGAVLADHPPSGIAEIDLLGEALTDSSRRINEAIGRERRFSSDVSHQLRTPLSGLRLRLERVRSGDDAEAIAAESLADLGRLEQTVHHLLAFARDSTPSTSASSLNRAAADAVERWAEPSRSVGRSVTLRGSAPATVRASSTSIDQILDVLIDNALTHGTGAISVIARRVAGGAAIDVADQGSSAEAGTDEELFVRGHGSNTGIGLALARSIADAEGGRLVIVRRQPTTFSLILLLAEAD
ncbi:MAG: HAMP domain-containing sensor histidine kinase [Ilumatobacteraceae bacterium]